jgi:hypothetical protein
MGRRRLSPITRPKTKRAGLLSGGDDQLLAIPILDSPNTFQDTTVDLEMETPANAIMASPSSATLTINSA